MNHQRVKFIPGEYNVVHEGKVVGRATLDENGKVTEARLSAEGLKQVDPDYDPTEGLSIVDPPEYDDINLLIGIDLTESYFREKEKGTFDA